MAWIIPLSISSGTTYAVGLNSTDSLFVSAGVTLASSVEEAVVAFGNAGTGQQIVVHGTLVGLQGLDAKPQALVSQMDLSLHVGAEGRITGLDGAAITAVASNLSIVNDGVLENLSASLAVIDLSASGAGGAFRISNTGLIEGGAYGVITTGTLGLTLVLNNSGTIRSGSAFIDDVGSTDTIVNTGLMVGDVLLSLGDDRFEGASGRLVGDLRGGSGNDRLVTGAGSESLYGDAGDDLLTGGAGGDRLDGGTGRDVASYENATAGVRVDLSLFATNTGDARGDRYFGIESLTGSAFADTLGGLAGVDVIRGGNGADSISGRGSNDVLYGGSGSDLLYGGAGADDFVFNTAPSATLNVDRILDFQPGLDDIVLNSAVYAALADGALASEAFRAGPSGLAGDATDRILHETDTGWLLYDRDGTGAAAAVRFAQVNVGLTLTAGDFTVV